MQVLNNGLKQNLNERENQIQLPKTVTAKRQEELLAQEESWNQNVLQGIKKMAQDEEYRKKIAKNLS